MRLDVSFEGLDALLRRLGGKPGGAAEGSVLEPIEDVFPANDVTALGKIVSGPGGLLAAQGRQVALYILDHTSERASEVLNDPQAGNRLHVFDCTTLRDTREKGRFKRYVATDRTGGFMVDVRGQGVAVERTRAELMACKYCLKELAYLGYRGGGGPVWREFDLAAFFAEYATFFPDPALDAETAPPSDYVRNWSAVSRRERERAGWRCSQCKVDLSRGDLRPLLHVHHVNGVKRDNAPANLRVLCAVCHAEQPGHTHMYVPPEDRRAIEAAPRVPT